MYKACERFETLGVNFVKKPDAGKQLDVAKNLSQKRAQMTY